MDLLRKKDLHLPLGIAKTTVAGWVDEYNIYIPKVKHGNVTYYKPEAIEVLEFIKSCREKNYQKPQILQLLSDKGFPITVDEAVNELKEVLEDTPRDSLMTVMKTMSLSVTKIAEQDERLNEQEERIRTAEERMKLAEDKLRLAEEHMKYQSDRLELMQERMKNVDQFRAELELFKNELAASKEKKGFFARMFGK